VAVVALIVCAVELLARYVVGLGDPPLFAMDAEIEYVMKPSRTYRRFGNRIAINQWSMRSDEFPRQKQLAAEFRLIVFGDSIIQGGAVLDQSEIATELLRTDLSTRLHRPVIVGNVSAGSWGPLNMVAYAERHGFFDADAVVIVLSSHDFADVPVFAPRGADWPTRAPLLAIQEAVTRYLPRYLPTFGEADSVSSAQARENSPPGENISKSLAALDKLIRLASADAKVAVALHFERDEPIDHPKQGHAELRKTAVAAGVPVLDFGPEFAKARLAGNEPYRDWIHPTAVGQAIIAKTIGNWVVATASP
jgi:hypothetical protein